MTAVIRNKRRADELESHKHPFDAVPVAPAGVEWFFDNHFVPGTDCTEDPWLEFEAELKKSVEVPFFTGVPTSTVLEPPVGLKEESKADPAEQQPSSLTSSASLGTVLRTCHHCKTVRACQPCVCTRTFCDRCVEKYPSLPQTTDPNGFRPQCPHCQELCTCARCRQRRMEEGPAPKVRSQRSTSAALKRQPSEEDEEYAPLAATIVKAEPEFVPSVELRATDPVKIEPAKMVLDEQEFDACGSWPPDDLSLNSLGAAGSSSSASSLRSKFVVSDDISNFMLSGTVRLNAVSHRRSASVGCIAETIESIEVASSHRIQAVVSAPSFDSVPVVKRDEVMSLAPSFRDAIEPMVEDRAANEKKPAAEQALVESPSGSDEQEDDTGDDVYATRHARHESRSSASAPAAPAPRQKKSRRLSDKLPKPRGSQGRKGSADSANAPSPSSERLVGPVCRECGTRTTPLWRAGPDGTKSLCNRCGIRWMRGVPLSRGPNSKACHAVADEVPAEHGRSRQVPCK